MSTLNIDKSDQHVKPDRDELAIAFLRRVLPPEGSGLYCLSKKSSTGGRKNVFADTIDELWNLTLDYDRGGRGNVYFALATFKDNSSRKAVNAVALKAFIADLDVDAAKAAKGAGYASLKEAGEGVKKFCTATGFPVPMVVQSGHGVHLYWPLDEPLPAAGWKPLAEKMKRLFAMHGLRADPAVTADAAGVLRVPGTTNRKAGKGDVEVSMNPAFLGIEPYELEKFLPALDPISVNGAAGSNVIQLNLGPKPSYLAAVTGWGLLEAVRVTEPFPESDAELIAEGCAQIRHMRDTGGIMTEPEWLPQYRCGCTMRRWR